MKFVVEKEIFEKLPTACFGVVVAKGIDNGKSYPTVDALLDESIAAAAAHFEGKKVKVITNGWCVAAFNSKMFLDAGQTYDLADIYFKFADLSNGRDNHKVVKTFLNRSGEVVDYVIRQTPEKFEVVRVQDWVDGDDLSLPEKI